MKIQSKTSGNTIAIVNTVGLKKTTNEDSIGFNVTSTGAVICLCDGHWGDFASKLAKRGILNKSFPKSKPEAIQDIKEIELQLWKKFGIENMDQNKDLTPETSLIAVEKIGNVISVMAYGDCRMIVCRQGLPVLELKTTATWLGAFSFLKLRGRISIEKALIFKKIICQPGDVVMLFSDGVDECKYEVKTIPTNWLASQTKELSQLEKIAFKIFDTVEQNGAEDNASLGLIKI